MDDQRADRTGSGSINASIVRVVLGVAVILIAFVLVPVAESNGQTAMSFVTLALLVGAAIAGSGVLMPFGLARWGAVLGFVLLLAFLLFVAAMTMGDKFHPTH
jgi:hypothetical protein